MEKKRRSIRLQDYDYRHGGVYFVTICTHDRENLFGAIENNAITLNSYGWVVAQQWEQTALLRPYLELDAFVVMPNHMHGIIIIKETNGVWHAKSLPTNRQFAQPIAHSLGTIIGGFKSAVSREINQLRGTPAVAVWQRNYYEHIVRSETELEAIRIYIETNPENWNKDKLFLE